MSQVWVFYTDWEFVVEALKFVLTLFENKTVKLKYAYEQQQTVTFERVYSNNCCKKLPPT